MSKLGLVGIVLGLGFVVYAAGIGWADSHYTGALGIRRDSLITASKDIETAMIQLDRVPRSTTAYNILQDDKRIIDSTLTEVTNQYRETN